MQLEERIQQHTGKRQRRSDGPDDHLLRLGPRDDKAANE